MNKLNVNIDYGKSLNKLMRDPSLIHKIQDALTSIKGSDTLSIVYSNGADKDPKSTIKQILSDFEDNAGMVVNTIGHLTMNMIFEYEGLETRLTISNYKV